VSLFTMTFTYVRRSDLAYVRVVGVLSRWQGFNSLVVDHIQQVADAHEPYHHVLHAIVDTLTYERGPPVRTAQRITRTRI